MKDFTHPITTIGREVEKRKGDVKTNEMEMLKSKTFWLISSSPEAKFSNRALPSLSRCKYSYNWCH